MGNDRDNSKQRQPEYQSYNQNKFKVRNVNNDQANERTRSFNRQTSKSFDSQNNRNDYNYEDRRTNYSKNNFSSKPHYANRDNYNRNKNISSLDIVCEGNEDEITTIAQIHESNLEEAPENEIAAPN